MKFSLFVLPFLFFSLFTHAETPITIEIGSNYEKYSDKELRRRVWQLERAVAQLQDQVFQLALQKGSSNQPIKVESPLWTCQMQSFGVTHVSSGITKASALAQVLKKCSDATNAIHCEESKAKCDNE